MPFPALVPSARSFDPGNWPVKTYRAQNGAEVRLLYGNTRTGMTLQLEYSNIPDTDAQQFLKHFNEVRGTYQTFAFTGSLWNRVLAGWHGAAEPLLPPAGTDWRYDGPPSLNSVRPGVSTVSVTLRGVI